MSSLSLQGEINKCLSAAYKNWIISRRNVFTVFELVFWPLISLLSIGLMTRFLGIGGDTVAFLLVGAIGLTILQICQIDVAYVLLFDMWSKSIKNTFVSPVRGYHLVLGALLFGMVRGTFAFTILVVISRILFGFDFLAGGVHTVVIFLAGVFAVSAIIGMIVCISILLFGQKADVAAWSLSGVIMLISGIYYPVSVLPEPLQLMARAVPLTYFLEYYRSAYGFGDHSIMTGVVMVAAYMIAGLIALEITIERARNTGILLRLSE
ncbi:MAG: ABC transporter permease [Methanothrix sp.]|nr:ABC transporter permease [Methanothrix sp.]MCX8206370.1 ABC transporter permease [Methanothrix sp.]